MRVLHYLDTDSFAGTEQHVLTLVHALTQQGVECAILGQQNTEFVRRAEILEGVTVFGVPAAALRGSQAQLQECRRQWQPDILHAHNGRTSLQCALCTWRGRRKPASVMTQHFVEPAHTHYAGPKRAVSTLLHTLTNRQLSRIIAIGDAVRASAIAREHLPPEKVVTVPNGIAVPQANPEKVRAALWGEGISETGPFVVTTARLTEEKGHRFLLDAVPMVKARFPGVQFLWLGRGPQEAALKAEIAARKQQATVHLLGFRDNAPDWVAFADALVLPSLCEPFGLAIVEAMMLGIPTIATNCGGPPEIITPAAPLVPVAQAVGWLVPPSDATALGLALCALLENPAEAKAVGQRGKETALARFTADRMAAQIRVLYEQIIGLHRNAV